MIDNDKIGSYIKELRTKKNLTQEELGNMIYVSRQAVSNWERGIDVPTIDNVKDIGKIFDVSIIDIYAGEKVKDIKTLNDVIHSLITLEIKKSKKILIISSFIIFILIVMFLTYYFITYYNNISVYNIKGDSTKYDINGILNKSVNNVYMNLVTDQTFDRICLVHDEDEILCQSDSNYLIFTEYNGYNEIMPLDNKEFNEYINDLYITIQSNEINEKIKIDFMRYFKNDNIIKDTYSDINANDNYELEFANVPEKIKKEFEYNEKEKGFYLKKNSNEYKCELLYFVEENMFNVNEDNDYHVKRWTYYLNDNSIVKYVEVDKKNNNKIEYYNITKNTNNTAKKVLYKYFKENYIDKYLN